MCCLLFVVIVCVSFILLYLIFVLFVVCCLLFVSFYITLFDICVVCCFLFIVCFCSIYLYLCLFLINFGSLFQAKLPLVRSMLFLVG